MPGACNLFRREQLRSLLSMAHGGSLTTDEFARRGGALSWTSSRGGAITGAKGCDRNVEVATPAAKLIERIGGKKGATSPALSPLQPTPEELLERARLTPAPVHYPLAQGEATGEDGRLARGRVASLA